MAVLIIVLKTIVAVLSVLLSLLILLHKGKGGGLSDMRRRVDRECGHIRSRGEEPEPLDGRHRTPVGRADYCDQSNRETRMTEKTCNGTGLPDRIPVEPIEVTSE